MLTLASKNDDDLLKESRELVESVSVQPGISSIVWPPFSNVYADLLI
jgi:hypothetical protein